MDEDWLCRTEADRHGSWFIRCDNLVELFLDDPVLANGNEPDATTRIPLHGAPYGDSDLDGLATAVLCGRDPSCRVSVALR
ncbi:MAG: hypothetical protein EP308_03090 [Burkholderiales bacterium]|nr:MAG: hypothetical protein EP308_03090 [Burkholderiales bacterium]